MRRTRRARFTLLVSVLGACRAAEREVALPPISPNRPTFSDGTSLIPVGHAQLETGYTFTRRNEADTDTERNILGELTARYRVSESVEARVLWGGYAWSSTDQGGAPSDEHGGTDAAVAILLPVAEQQDWRPALVFEATTTLGAGSESFSSGHADPTAKLLWSYGGGGLPEWLGVGGNLIVSYPTEDGDRFTQPAASLWTTWSPAASDTSVFAEWFVIGRPANNVEHSQSADVGVVHRLNDRTAIDARVGFGLDSRADDFFTGVGISLLF